MAALRRRRMWRERATRAPKIRKRRDRVAVGRFGAQLSVYCGYREAGPLPTKVYTVELNIND